MDSADDLLTQTVSEVALHMAEIGKVQIELINKIIQSAAGLPEGEKEAFLALADRTWMEVQQVQDKAKLLRSLR